jgi:hypothetical protein
MLPSYPETSGGIHCVKIQQGMLQQDTLQYASLASGKSQKTLFSPLVGGLIDRKW